MRFPDVEAMLDRAVEWLRARSRRFDHFWRAQERFFEVQGGLLSAAIAYYAFFAALSLSLLALSVLGYLLELPQLYDIVETWLAANLPIIEADSITASRQTAGLIALTVLAITGVSWVQSIRSSIRAVWLLNPEPGHPILRVLVDFLVLAALGVLLIATLTVTAGVEVGLHWLSNGYRDGFVARVISYGGTGIGILVNTLLAAALLSGLPRLALPLRRVLPPALWVALGLELLKTLGAMYITRVEARPAYQAVGTAVGLLIFLYVFNQMLLFAASWTATSSRGNVLDMADARREVGAGREEPTLRALTAGPEPDGPAEPVPVPTALDPVHPPRDPEPAEPTERGPEPTEPADPTEPGPRDPEPADPAESDSADPAEPADPEPADPEPAGRDAPDRSGPQPLRIWPPGAS